MITEDKITANFCIADDFCKYFSSELKKRQLADGIKHRDKSYKLLETEVITMTADIRMFPYGCCRQSIPQDSSMRGS